MRRILVALSGGIDSAATALILKERGYDVSAVTFDITGDRDALDSARELAEKLEIPFRVEDVREVFERDVIGYFTTGYMRGETPAPCSYCNPEIKWKTLLRVADREGIPWVATGHYVRIVHSRNRYYIAQGVDPVKDQSYYLWGLGQEVLSRAVTPLGDMTKTAIRELMSRSGFPALTRRKESMSVCFLKGCSYTDFLRERMDGVDALNGGEVVDLSGRVIGRHSGYPFYTIGQKRGFQVDTEGSYYVLDIDAGRNRLIVGGIDNLRAGRLSVRDYYIADRDEFFSAENLRIKVRGLGLNPEGYCRVREGKDDIVPGSLQPGLPDLSLCPGASGDPVMDSGEVPRLVSRLDISVPAKAYAPAKGQPVVFYIEDRVVGGGYLDEYGSDAGF